MTPLGVAAVEEPDDRAPARARPVLAMAARAVPQGSSSHLAAVPRRSEELTHMSLDRLRAYRRSLLVEELRTSYWRTLLKTRRDLAALGDLAGDLGLLRTVLTEARAPSGPRAILALHPEEGLPMLPQLPALWATEVASDRLVDGGDLAERLATAESVLSSYREALHRRLDRATADLVARYHEDPRACLHALPSP